MHADRQAAMLLAGILALAGCAGANRPSLGGSDLVVPDHLPGQPDAPDDADDLATDPGSQDPTPGDAAAVDTDAAPQDLPPEIDLATPPQLVLSDTSLDFGTAACAADAAAKRTLTLHNAGGSPLTWAAALSADDAFALPAETGGTLAAGGTATLDVTLKGVPANATAATPWTATLTVTSNDPTAPSVAIPLKVTPLGATLALAPPTAAFGQVPLDGPGAQLSLTLTNTGNLPVDVTPGQPPDDAFALTWTAAPAAVTLGPGASLPGLVATFKPVTATAVQVAAPLATAGTVCTAGGTSATAIELSGEGTMGQLGFSPAEFFFGQVACGTKAPAQALTLVNAGNGAFKFNLTLAAGAASPYTVTPKNGTVPANGQVDVTVQPNGVPAKSDVTDDGLADLLTLSTSLPGDAPHPIPLHLTAKGAILTVLPTSLSFGDVPIQSTADRALKVTNAGNAPATLTLAVQGAAFAVTPSDPTALPPATTLDADATFTPLTPKALSGKITFAVGPDEPLCAPLPSALPLKGTGTNGVINVSAAALDFGHVDCGNSAAPQTLTLTNQGNGAFTWAAAAGLGAATPYEIQPSSGTVAPGGFTVIVVTPLTVPTTCSTAPDGLGDVLTVTTSIVNDAPHGIVLHQTARGAVLSFDPPSVDFGGVPMRTTASGPFSIRNDGNAPAGVKLVLNAPAAFGLDSAGPLTVAAAGHADDGITFQPVDAATLTGEVSLAATAGTVLCLPLPPALTLSGSGI